MPPSLPTNPQMVKMRDGCRLATFVYASPAQTPAPVIFIRTAYGAKAPDPDAAVVDGYVMVIQDCRGRHHSEGEMRLAWDDAPDGQDSIAWIAEQPWCNGNIAMTGGSYLGMVQVPAASGGHECLKCITPAVSGCNFFTDWSRIGGCPTLTLGLGWLLQQTCARTPLDPPINVDLLRECRTLADIKTKFGLTSQSIDDWLGHDTYDEYWQAVDRTHMYPKVKIPSLHTGCWFDAYSTGGDIAAYQGIRQHSASPQARAQQRLLIGPWSHGGWGKHTVRALDFGTHAVQDVAANNRRFFDWHLKGIDNGMATEAPVRVFMLGRNEWQEHNEWPPRNSRPQIWHLATQQGLSQNRPSTNAYDSFDYDPNNPAPFMRPAEAIAEASKRHDVICYRSAELASELMVAGNVQAEIWLSSSAEDSDVFVTLAVERRDGQQIALLAGCMRARYRDGWDRYVALEPGTPTRLMLNLRHIAMAFQPGERIVLAVSSSAFPEFLPHPNTLTPSWQEWQPKVAHQRIHHGGEHASALHLPVVESGSISNIQHGTDQ